ncbi:MAG: hypothetical protein Q7T18_07535, partial [Sedimentisphaerales bacterium]|nr:hypothetical protein [Sedimentisphaerales bacterium]
KMVGKSDDKRGGGVINVLKAVQMFGKFRKNKYLWPISLITIKWYPSTRSCVKMSRRPLRHDLMPPLMVRKAAWRR